MGRRDRVSERLAAIAALRADPEAGVAELRKAVRSKTGLVIAAAVEIIAEARLEPLLSELAPAFARLLEDPVKRDPQCRGKIAVVRALVELERWEDEVFAAAIAHVQREPVWGGSQDTAAELRGLAALGYAQLRHPDAVAIIADLLADPERAARLGAARALGDSARIEAIALLRFKARIGDDEPEIAAAVFASLLALDPEAVEYVAGYLGAADELVAESAALALGESRLEPALPYLIAFAREAVVDDRRRVGYLAVALTRLEPGIDVLLEAIAGEAASAATLAIAALAPFAYDADLGARVREAAAKHPDPAVVAAAQEAFGDPG